jgi:hypothetical protein
MIINWTSSIWLLATAAAFNNYRGGDDPSYRPTGQSKGKASGRFLNRLSPGFSEAVLPCLRGWSMQGLIRVNASLPSS